MSEGSGPGPGALGAAPSRVPPVPVVPRCARDGSGVRPGLGGPSGLFPSPFPAGPSGPALATLRSGWAPPGRLAARRSGPGRPPAAACGPPLPVGRTAGPRAAGVRLAVWGPPCGALRACCARPRPSPGGPCARLRLRRVPLAGPLRAGPGGPPSLLPPPGLARLAAGCSPRPGGVGCRCGGTGPHTQNLPKGA